MKKNCWEILGCDKKECPVISEERLNGIHGGLNAGSACWVVAGTRCKGVFKESSPRKWTIAMNVRFIGQ